MSSHSCEFFGGPIHEKKIVVPDHINVFDIAEMTATEALEFFESDETYPSSATLVIRYTRVFNRRTPTNQFEYVGRL